jgi:hypothetical protein
MLKTTKRGFTVFIMEKLCLLFVYDYYGIGEDAAA